MSQGRAKRTHTRAGRAQWRTMWRSSVPMSGPGMSTYGPSTGCSALGGGQPVGVRGQAISTTQGKGVSSWVSDGTGNVVAGTWNLPSKVQTPGQCHRLHAVPYRLHFASVLLQVAAGTRHYRAPCLHTAFPPTSTPPTHPPTHTYLYELAGDLLLLVVRQLRPVRVGQGAPLQAQQGGCQRVVMRY